MTIGKGENSSNITAELLKTAANQFASNQLEYTLLMEARKQNFTRLIFQCHLVHNRPEAGIIAWYLVLDILVPMYQYNNMSKAIQRVQTGVRIEKRLLKVLKALAEQLDMSLGDLLEGMALHCFEGKAPFSDATLGKIEKLKEVYELDLNAEDSHKLDERGNND